MKEALSAIATLGTIVAIIGPMLYFGFIRNSIAENRIRKMIHEEVLKGNKVAIAMKIDSFSTMVSPENE